MPVPEEHGEPPAPHPPPPSQGCPTEGPRPQAWGWSLLLEMQEMLPECRRSFCSPPKILQSSAAPESTLAGFFFYGCCLKKKVLKSL